MNGATEALVGSVKRALNATIGCTVLTFSELLTVMYECAQLVNQRPIGRHPTDPTDGRYLCPNDLILGRATPDVPSGPFLETRLTKRFHFIEQLVDGFWKKWTRNFFPGLLVRSKWHVDRRNVKIGDIVLVKDSNAIRGEWKMALVTDVHPSDDGRVRKVTIMYKSFVDSKTSSKQYKDGTSISIERAVHNLIVVVPVDGVHE